MMVNTPFSAPIITHFSTLHDLIKGCEGGADIGFKKYRAAPCFKGNVVEAIVEATGPEFLGLFESLSPIKPLKELYHCIANAEWGNSVKILEEGASFLK